MKEVSHGIHFFDDAHEDRSLVDSMDNGFSDEQLSLLEEAEQSTDARERQIAQIAKSVHELAQLFHEMSILVTEQGTILDRIDYNVESSLVDIKKGVTDMDEAEEWQKGSRWCLCTGVLLIVVFALIMIMWWKFAKESK